MHGLRWLYIYFAISAKVSIKRYAYKFWYYSECFGAIEINVKKTSVEV